MTGANQPYSQTISFTSSVRNVLSDREYELYELAKTAGVTIDPQVFRVLVELLKLDVSPAAVFSVLQNMAQQVSKPSSVLKKNTQNKNAALQSSGKKKPPVAAKPKKIKVES